MNDLLDFMKQTPQELVPREDEYLNETDGLLYCKRCHAPRQCRVPLNGAVVTRRVSCDCQEEAYLAAERERKQTEHLLHIAELKASGLQDRALHRCTFANDNGANPEMRKAHAYVERWPEMKERGVGLLLWGGVGTGKTFFAGCIANALLEQGVPVLMTNLSRVLNAMGGYHSEERNHFVDSLRHYDLLIIDDLGIERDTDFALEQVFHVIDSRCRSGLPMIVTTNLTLQEMRDSEDTEHQRIYDRVLERCVPLMINGCNLRAEHAQENLRVVKQLLCDA